MEFIAERVIALLGSLAAKELEIICNFKDDLESMESMVRAIKAVLLDAEQKATRRHQINDWLQKLKDVLLDAEDLLDACSAEELGREVMTKDKKMAKEVRIFFSKSNRNVCAATMGREIKAIRKKLDGIFYEKNNLHLSEISPSASSESNDWRQTHSFVREEDVVGREAEKKSLVSTLLNPHDVNCSVSVVPIVGIGGLGKTALAQQVYNDEDVKIRFEGLMKWVCVSDESVEFKIKRIAQNIVGKEYDTMEEVAKGLRETIEGKRFLLVLDDVWNDDREKWLELERLLRGGEKGSMIIVTTRSEKVAQIMGTLDEPFRLGDLDFTSSWELFCRVAFRDGKEPENQELVVIGKDIVRGCSGVPLAIRTIGSLLFTKRLGVSEWSCFRDNELANMDSENKIISILKLSYDHLPSHLKNCFAFCSLFPKDYLIKRKTLIQLWIAEGFIIQCRNKNMEDVGDEYFEQLLSRCLFQDVMRDDFGDIECCKMHDLIHDLAYSIAKSECYIVTSSERMEENLTDRIRHVSSHFDGAWKFPTNDIKTKKIRTILSIERRWQFIQSNFKHSHFETRHFDLICDPATSLPKHLRVLTLRNSSLQIPMSMQNLKQLRHLDLTRSFMLKKLPQDITELHNLLTLILNECPNLIELPKDMKRLVRLRHLELDDCKRLMSMPCGLGCLTNLQTLIGFVVNEKRSGGASISELHDLIWLRRLKIHKLERQRSNIKEVKSSKFLLHMPYLLELKLEWSLLLLEPLFWEEAEQTDEIILEALEPPHTIKALHIKGFDGKCLSKWIGSLMLLQTLYIKTCTTLASLPESIGSLTSLKMLYLDYCPALASLPESFGSLTSLQTLHLNDCFALISLPESFGSLTYLRTLHLNYCSALASLPKSFGSLTSLQTLHLYHCYTLASLPTSIKNLTSLQCVHIFYCLALRERYGRQLEGVDWPRLAHVPDVQIR